MIYIGCHLSVTDGYEAMGKTMLDFGGNTFAFFTRNPRGGKTKEISAEDAGALCDLLKQENFGPLVAHGSYTMNLCSANTETRANGLDMLSQDIERMEMLPGNFYNFHPGAHTGQGVEIGIEQIADGLNRVMHDEMQTTILLETMAGKGTEIGGTFEELQEIIDRVDCKDRIGVCLDTCHVWDAGYDIVGDLDGVLHRFDEISTEMRTIWNYLCCTVLYRARHCLTFTRTGSLTSIFWSALLRHSSCILREYRPILRE